MADQAGLIAALAHDDAMHQRLRHAVGARMYRDHLGILGLACDSRRRHQSGREQRANA
jgi:hypothetical protein